MKNDDSHWALIETLGDSSRIVWAVPTRRSAEMVLELFTSTAKQEATYDLVRLPNL